MRIATYNIGDYSGATFQKGSINAKTILSVLINSENADLWAMQEDEEFFNEETKETPIETLYKSYKYCARRGTGRYNFKSFLSNHEIKDVQQIHYTGDVKFGHKWFLSATLLVNNKEIRIICLHFDWTDIKIRSIQIQQVLDYVKNYEYSIIMGDFNPTDFVSKQKLSDKCTLSEDIKPFLQAGYITANAGEFGYFDTLPLSPEHYACDNILVSHNIKILNVGVTNKSWMNDHAILWADIEIV